MAKPTNTSSQDPLKSADSEPSKKSTTATKDESAKLEAAKPDSAKPSKKRSDTLPKLSEKVDKKSESPEVKADVRSVANDASNKPAKKSAKTSRVSSGFFGGGDNKPKDKVIKKRKTSLGRALFLLLVIIPTLIVSYYYVTLSSDQYQAEMRFSVRGTNTSPLESLGLSALPGNSLQAADAYIVIDYITSQQVLSDINKRFGVDMRTFFSKREIDPLYRIDADMPLEEFIYYWRWMVDASFNSTTGITTFRVNAFTGKDAGEITQLVLKVANDLVNDLSTEAREQLINNAESEVTRTEERLSAARAAITSFRDKEQSVNPTMQAESDQELIQSLQKGLIDLRARRAALLGSVTTQSPAVRVIDRQIAATVAALEEQRRQIGSGAEEEQSSSVGRNLSEVFSEYSGLELEQEFSEKAYTSALASLETSQAEARKQERYFAIILEPTTPAIALYPLRIINTLIAFGAFLILWLMVYLTIQAIKEHAV